LFENLDRQLQEFLRSLVVSEFEEGLPEQELCSARVDRSTPSSARARSIARAAALCGSPRTVSRQR